MRDAAITPTGRSQRRTGRAVRSFPPSDVTCRAGATGDRTVVRRAIIDRKAATPLRAACVHCRPARPGRRLLIISPAALRPDLLCLLPAPTCCSNRPTKSVRSWAGRGRKVFHVQQSHARCPARSTAPYRTALRSRHSTSLAPLPTRKHSPCRANTSHGSRITRVRHASCIRRPHRCAARFPTCRPPTSSSA